MCNLIGEYEAPALSKYNVDRPVVVHVALFLSTIARVLLFVMLYLMLSSSENWLYQTLYNIWLTEAKKGKNN